MTLTKTLSFQLDIQTTNGESRLLESRHEARKAYNQTIKLAKQGTDWDEIRKQVENDTNLVVNTTQLIVEKALEAMEITMILMTITFPVTTKTVRIPFGQTIPKATTCFLAMKQSNSELVLNLTNPLKEL
jgi:hypothetical protein